MNQELRAQLQCVLKQKKREAVCAYLAKTLAKTDGRLAKDFLSELVAIGNDDCDLYLDECLDGHFYVKFAQPSRISESSMVLYADNFASPALIKLMRFCEGAESLNPKMCAIFWLERFFTHIKPSTGKVPLTEKQRDAAIARFANEVDDSECIEFVNDSLSDYIKEYLA